MESLPKYGMENAVFLFSNNLVLIKCGSSGSKNGNGNIKRKIYLPK